MNVSGRVAYVPQSPWIFNASVKSNIVMGTNYDAEFYKTVIKFSALERVTVSHVFHKLYC